MLKDNQNSGFDAGLRRLAEMQMFAPLITPQQKYIFAYPPQCLLLLTVLPLTLGICVRLRGTKDGQNGAYLFVNGDPVFVLVLSVAAWWCTNTH